MIIDIHAHTTNKSLLGLHTENASIPKIEELMEKNKIDLTVLMATYFPLKMSGLKNEVLSDRISGNKNFLMFGSLDAMNNLKSGMENLYFLLKTKSIAGIKLYPGYQKFHPSNSPLFPLYEMAEKFNVPVAIHTGELHHCCQYKYLDKRPKWCRPHCLLDERSYLAHPNIMARAVKKFPKVKFIFSHLSNPYFEDLREMMEIFPNIYTDISGQFLSGTIEARKNYKDLIKREIRKFLRLKNGINRIMFGTDFPIQSQKDSIALVKSLHLSEKDEEKFFFRNAAKILKLKGIK